MKNKKIVNINGQITRKDGKKIKKKEYKFIRNLIADTLDNQDYDLIGVFDQLIDTGELTISTDHVVVEAIKNRENRSGNYESIGMFDDQEFNFMSIEEWDKKYNPDTDRTHSVLRDFNKSSTHSFDEFKDTMNSFLNKESIHNKIVIPKKPQGTKDLEIVLKAGQSYSIENNSGCELIVKFE